VEAGECLKGERRSRKPNSTGPEIDEFVWGGKGKSCPGKVGGEEDMILCTGERIISEKELKNRMRERRKRTIVLCEEGSGSFYLLAETGRRAGLK